MNQIIVVGAGLAGLNSARRLRESGHDVTVLEANDRPGGRVDTELVDGFRCDRGFQLLNPAYPAARRALDLGRLDLHAFDRGVSLRTEGGREVVADPTRHPARVLGLLGGTVSVGDLKAAYRWATASHADDETLAASLDAAGFSPRLRRVIDRFLAGVVLDPELQTSARNARQLVRYFAMGSPSLPAQGMAAIAHQLAEGLDISYGAHVSAIEPDGDRWRVRLAEGAERTCDAVVIAAGPWSCAQLLGVPESEMVGCTTWWFAADTRPADSRFLHLDVRDDARLAHTSVVSNVCPSYAPAGAHLVEATAVGNHGLDDDAARQLSADLLGADGTNWRLLVRHDIPHALPHVAPDTTELATGDRTRVVAGDTATASIQGALASGAAAATAVVDALR